MLFALQFNNINSTNITPVLYNKNKTIPTKEEEDEQGEDGTARHGTTYILFGKE